MSKAASKKDAPTLTLAVILSPSRSRKIIEALMNESQSIYVHIYIFSRIYQSNFGEIRSFLKLELFYRIFEIFGNGKATY